jgi:hypothetical protein
VQQLELFPQPIPTPQYKAGDWVKIKRKPAIAAWVKRGEIFKVNAVHPIDGSIQFWNPYINQWDFLYPDEIKPCPTPLTVETVVENLKPALTVETVVENLKPALTVETVVGNTKRKDSSYNSNGWIDFHYKIRIDGKQHSIRHWQNKCTGPYYTYRWLENKKQRAKYIGRKKFGEAYKAIAIGQPVDKILEIISAPNKLDAILKKRTTKFQNCKHDTT